MESTKLITQIQMGCIFVSIDIKNILYTVQASSSEEYSLKSKKVDKKTIM